MVAETGNVVPCGCMACWRQQCIAMQLLWRPRRRRSELAPAAAAVVAAGRRTGQTVDHSRPRPPCQVTTRPAHSDNNLHANALNQYHLLYAIECFLCVLMYCADFLVYTVRFRSDRLYRAL